MKKQEFIENLKNIYENCSVYFDIQERGILVKEERTKEEEERKRENENRIRQSGPHELITITFMREFHDELYTLEESYFQLVLTKNEEWESKEGKEVENVGSLIRFFEWLPPTYHFEVLKRRLYRSRLIKENNVEESFPVVLKLEENKVSEKGQTVENLLLLTYPNFSSSSFKRDFSYLNFKQVEELNKHYQNLENDKEIYKKEKQKQISKETKEK